MALKFYNWNQVRDRVPYTRTHIGRLEKAGEFPKRVKIGPARVVWVAEEVDEWLEKRVAERDYA